MKSARWILPSLLLVVAACGDDDSGDGDPNMDSEELACSSDMFDKYGTDAFLAVNDRIIELAVAAPTSMVGTSFQDLAAKGEARVESFRTNLANFLVFVYGGPNNYDGPSMEAAHTGLDITSDQYDYFVTNIIVPALTDSGVPEADISNCFAPPVVDADFKASIVGR